MTNYIENTCVIIPFYNEADRFSQEVFIKFLQENPALHFCLVNDGSTDSTASILNKLGSRYPQLIILQNEKNSGKAEVIRLAMLHVMALERFDYFAYFDADLATPLCEIFSFFNILQTKPNVQMIFGSRFSRIGSAIERRFIRHIMGRVFATFADLILDLSVYDTQCGAKLFSKEIAQEVFSKTFISRWIFDVEIFARIKRKWGKKKTLEILYELPLNSWKEIGKSKITIKSMIKIPWELGKIYLQYKK